MTVSSFCKCHTRNGRGDCPAHRERFTLLEYGPIITPAMRAARADELEMAKPFVHGCLFPFCEEPAERYRRNTAYADDESNWSRACAEHQKMDHDEMQDLWDMLHDDIREGIAQSMRGG